MFRHSPLAVMLLALAVTVAACSSAPSPTQPTPPAATTSLEHFESLVGTNWTGTATYTSGGQTSRVNVSFIWNGGCYIPGWCEWGANSYGLATVDGISSRFLGYNDDFTAGMYRRELYVGQPPLNSGRWDSALLSTDRQHLVITSSDFVWDQRRGVTIELTRAPWPADLDCPILRNCNVN